MISYDQDTGLFYRLSEAGAAAILGTNQDGYIRFRFNQTRIMAHRLAWFLSYGKMPTGEIDHINGVKTDNRISNLREATRSENMRNMGAKKTNHLGVKGVRKMPDGKFQARITLQGNVMHLGTFKTVEEAKSAHDLASIKFHGEFSTAKGMEK